MAPNNSPNISGLKNIFALSIVCFAISAMKNFQVTSMRLGWSRGDMDEGDGGRAVNYMDELSMRKNPSLESSFFAIVGGGLGEDDEDDSSGTRDERRPPQSDLNDPDQRNKRFLGTMARGNWFPRPFRRFIDSDMYPGSDLTKYRHVALLTYPEKKHVESSVTRVKLLTMPSSSALLSLNPRRHYLQRQDNLDDEDEDEEEEE